MMPRLAPLVFALLLACGSASPRVAPTWREADAAAFAEAARDHRFVLLSLQADWCHWCHVMNATTFADPDVLALLAAHFVVVRADADARPDLAERYTNYGWPATIVFSSDGRELVRLRGYRDPAAMRAILASVIAGETTLTGTPREPSLDDLDEARALVRAQLDELYDASGDGWGREQKYPFAALVRHGLLRGRDLGEDGARTRALRSLARYAELIDPVWGGMYQYSEHGDWSHPHFEKIASIQAGAIAAFADAYVATGDPAWLTHARAILRYIEDTLTSASGAFYASQDADLRIEGHEPVLGAAYYALDEAGRRVLGVPHVDTHVYASVNGELAAALARLAEVTRDADVLARATRCVDEVTRTHRDARGLFRHEATAEDTRYLADQAQMLVALVALHQASGAPELLAQATALADVTLATFQDETGALRSRTGDDVLAGTLMPIEDNALVAHALLVLTRLEDREDRHDEALRILRAVAVPSAIGELGRKVGEYAIALELARLGMVSFTVVGDSNALVGAVHAYDEPRRVLVRQPGEGHYPLMDEPVLFVCGDTACSAPIAASDHVASVIDRFFDR